MHKKSGILVLALVIAGLLAASLLAAAPRSDKERFTARLSGKKVVPPVKTAATGEAAFRLSKDGATLFYILRVSNIENPTAAHIHLAPAGKNGPPVVVLYPAPGAAKLPQVGKFTGVVAKGPIFARDLVGPLAKKPLKDLMAEIRAGRTYVNVHTKRYPDGEIRGQIR